MVGVDELRARVEQRWAAGEHPAWPPPRAGDEPPRDEEYSRCTDPGRYRVVHERGRLWAEVLGELPGVTVEETGPGGIPTLAGDPPLTPTPYERGLRVRCDRPGTLPLLLLERSVPQGDGQDQAVLHVCVGDPRAGLTSQPGCGCDACDDGSEAMLGAIDDQVLVAVGGPLAIVRGWEAHASWSPGGGGEGGTPAADPRITRDLCRRLAAGEDVAVPPGARAYVGRSWLG